MKSNENKVFSNIRHKRQKQTNFEIENSVNFLVYIKMFIKYIILIVFMTFVQEKSYR